MALNEYEIKKAYDNDYNEAINMWQPTLQEMYTDLRFFLGDQWNDSEKRYLQGEGRNTYVYNYLQRNIFLNSGYQRKNRLGFGVDPQQPNDSAISDYLQDGLIWQANRCDFYNKISDGFEDASISGLSLISFGLDYSIDTVNGRLYCDVEPFQSNVLDPTFTKSDFSDCRYLLKRKYYSRQKCKTLLPSARKDIDKVKGGRIDNKFDYMSVSRNGMTDDDILAYDEYYRRTTRKVKILTHRFTGDVIKWRGTKENLENVLQQYPYYEVTEIYEPSVEYNVLIQDQVMYSGIDPLGIHDFPCVPILWVYKPQYDDFIYKLQGMVRPIRDASSEFNKKRSKISSIIDSQGTTGYIVEKGAVTNQEDLYQTGQGIVIETEVGRLNSIREKNSVDIHPGLVQLVQMLNADMMQIPGLNQEALGVAEGGNTEVSGILAKQRSSSSITIFQTVYDKLNQAQKECGIKILRIMLANYTPQMWEKITGRPMPEGLDIDKIMEFDVVVKETLLTDTQKNLSYFQALEALKVGIKIPQQYMREMLPISNKTRLEELYQEEVKAEQAAAEQQNQLQTIQLQAQLNMINARAEADKGLAIERASRVNENVQLGFERRTQAIENLEMAKLDRAKTIKELESMSMDNLQRLLEISKFLVPQAAQAEQTAVEQSQQNTNMQQVGVG